MRDTTSIYARFLRARVVARGDDGSAHSSNQRARSALIWRNALAWVLGIDTDLQERLKSGAGLEEIPVSQNISLWRVDLAGDDEDDAESEASDASAGAASDRWWLLEVPPRDHPDGTRTELWSAFLSDAQFHELAKCVDAMRGISPQPNPQPNPQPKQMGGAA